MNQQITLKKANKALALLLGLLAVGLILYLLLLPLYPYAKLYFFPPVLTDTTPAEINNRTAIATSTTATSSDEIKTPQITGDRIIIKKIGVDAPIIESKSEQYGLNHGAWIMPQGSTPGKDGNTIITGHRFKYLPPNNLTFFLINKLVKGDIIEISWKGSGYRYSVESTKIIPATELSILAPTEEPLLTIFSCDPIFSTKNRLVVLAKPI